MKKTFVAIAGAVALLSATAVQAQNRDVMKPWEITLGAHFFTGDLDSLDTGFVVGVDYSLNKNYNSQMMTFVGARGWFGDDATTWGVHYGVRFGMPANPAGGSSNNSFYFKIAAGWYFSDLDVLGDDNGIGGFAAVGWLFNPSFGAEVGYQIGPDVSGTTSTGIYAAATFRV